jgi:hypothetical protein
MRLSQEQPYVLLDNLLVNGMLGPALVWFGHGKTFINHVFKISVTELDTFQAQ